MKKVLALFAVALVWTACSTAPTLPSIVLLSADSESTGKYQPQALLVEKSKADDVKALRTQTLKAMSAAPEKKALFGATMAQLSSVYEFNAKADGENPLPVKFADEQSAQALGEKLLAFQANREISFLELYDRLCVQVGAVWWVDGTVVITEKTRAAP